MLLFDEVHKCPADETRRWLESILKYEIRMFGFTATPERSDGGQIAIEAYFGPEICHFDYQEVQEDGGVAPIHVMMMATSGAKCDAQDPAVKTRHLIWRNRARNQEIAKACRELVSLGQVLTITETLEHALHLSKELPDWPVVFKTKPSASKKYGRAAKRAVRMLDMMEELNVPHMSDTERDEIERGFREQHIRGVIATKMWREAIDFPALQFVVRTEAMSASAVATQGGGRSSRPFAGKTCGIILDTEDEFDSTMAARKRGRVSTYKKLGWTVHRNVFPDNIKSCAEAILATYQPEGVSHA
jgi:superfamily II DNA or RNA helicase